MIDERPAPPMMAIGATPLSEALRWLLRRYMEIDRTRLWAREIALDAGVSEATVLDWRRSSGAQPLHALRLIRDRCHELPQLARSLRKHYRGDNTLAKAYAAVLQKEIKVIQRKQGRAAQEKADRRREPVRVQRLERLRVKP